MGRKSVHLVQRIAFVYVRYSSISTNPLHSGPSSFPLLYKLSTHLAVLRITQRLNDTTLRLVPDQSPQTIDQEPREDIHTPLIRQQRQHLADIEPAAEALEQLARPLDALREVLDVEEFLEQKAEQLALLCAGGKFGLRHGQHARCGRA